MVYWVPEVHGDGETGTFHGSKPNFRDNNDIWQVARLFLNGPKAFFFFESNQFNQLTILVSPVVIKFQPQG